jgi:hypothetical protein
MPIPSVVGFNSPSLAELWFSNEVRVLPSPSSPDREVHWAHGGAGMGSRERPATLVRFMPTLAVGEDFRVLLD